MYSYDELKLFCGVQFSNKTHEVVPKAWITYKNRSIECLWPKNNNLELVRLNNTKRCLPCDTENWHPVMCTVLTHSSK